MECGLINLKTLNLKLIVVFVCVCWWWVMVLEDWWIYDFKTWIYDFKTFKECFYGEERGLI